MTQARSASSTSRAGSAFEREREPWTHLGVGAFRTLAAGRMRAFPKGGAGKSERTGADFVGAGQPLASVPAAYGALRDDNAFAFGWTAASHERSVALRLRVGKPRKANESAASRVEPQGFRRPPYPRSARGRS